MFRQEKQVKFTTSQHKKRMWKNPDKNTVARRRAQISCTTKYYHPFSQHILHHLSPLPFLPNSLSHAPQTPTPTNLKYHKDISQRPKSMKYHRKPHKNITVSQKPNTVIQWTMGVHSISCILQHHHALQSLHHIVTINPNPWLKSPITIAWVHATSRHSPIYALTY